MGKPLRLLLLEDLESDARLVLSELRRSGFEPAYERIDSENEFLKCIEREWDLILADFNLPQFDALRALGHLRRRDRDIPFIVVSGSIGEETAAEAIKQGATDYLLKDRLGRLGQAVTLALEQRDLRDAQRTAQLRFRAIFNQTFEFVALLSANGAVLEINKPALEFRGLSPAHVVGERLWKTPWLDTSAETSELVEIAVKQAAAGGFVRHELTIEQAGQPRVFDFSVKPVADESGRIEFLIAEAREITEQKHLEVQLRQSQKMEAIGKLAGGVAHDFNNLLTVINGYSDVLLDGIGQGDPNRDCVEQIQRAGERAAAITRQLLAFSRKQILQPKVVNLNDIVTAAEGMLRRLIGEDIRVETKLDAQLNQIKFDPGEIEQIILNLAVNARDAMPNGGTLTLQTSNVYLDEDYVRQHQGSEVGPHVMLAVADTGMGMDASTRERIFEPFFSTKGHKGTGLGLSTVFGIVKQSGGNIWVYSELERGTVFKVYLPSCEDEQTVTTPKPKQSEPKRDATILVVEDEPSVRKLIEFALTRGGYRVLSTGDPREAIDICQQPDEIDVLLTDVVLPNMGGAQLAEEILKLRPGVIVVYMSGYTDDTIARHGVLDPNVRFLEKPITPRALLGRLDEFLSS